jgi:lysophospholipase L1-like esterase
MERVSIGAGIVATILRSRVLRVILPALAVLALSGHAQADGITPRIMPLGDSITRGWFGSAYSWGYRKPLYDKLINGGYSFDFVGVKADGSFPDPSHEGRDGWQANELLNGRPSAPAEGKLANWLIADQPDIVLLHIGTNDVTWGDINFNDVNGILNVIDAYEAANNKHITVILALIINRRIDSPAVLRAQTTQFNIDVNNMATNRIANGDDIIIVNMESALNYNIGVDMADDVHPNDNGYAKMAAVWYDALADYFSEFSISGYVLEADGSTPVEGVLIQTDDDINAVTDVNGFYELRVDYNWSGNVTASKYACALMPISIHYEDVNHGYTDQDYTGNTFDFRITGFVSNDCNAPIEGVLVDANNGGGQGTTDANGFYEVWVDEGWSGTVTVSRQYYTFEPGWMAYDDMQADVADQNYIADSVYDLDCDGSIGWGDFGILADDWLLTGPEIPGDFVVDGTVNFMDFADFKRVWQD